MVGLRGINGPQGGIETHVEALSTLMVQRGWDVEVLARRPYMNGGRRTWRGVDIIPLWSPRSQKYQTLVHSALSVGLLSFRRPDVLHIHGIGPALMTPLAKLSRLKTVVTHHGYNYEHEKWGCIARTVFKSGENAGMCFADAAIAVAENIARDLSARYGRDVHFLPNGVFPPAVADAGLIGRFGLEPRRYVLHVARMVPEKRHLDLIAAYGQLSNPGYKLVMVGAADHPNDYDSAVKAAAAATPGVVMLGFRRGEELAALFANAGLFALPSSHEAMPIALLEALSYGVPALASAIDGNLALGMPDANYHQLGDQDGLAARMAAMMVLQPSPEERAVQIETIRRRYGWDRVADSTSALYAGLLRRERAGGPLRVRESQPLSRTK